MTNYERGEVILLHFPFTNLSEGKKRPALIISTDIYNSSRKDVIAAAITGNIKTKNYKDTTLSGWDKAGLLKESIVKCVLFTLEKTLIIRKIGKLEEEDMKKVSENIREALGL